MYEEKGRDGDWSWKRDDVGGMRLTPRRFVAGFKLIVANFSYVFVVELLCGAMTEAAGGVG